MPTQQCTGNYNVTGTQSLVVQAHNLTSDSQRWTEQQPTVTQLGTSRTQKRNLEQNKRAKITTRNRKGQCFWVLNRTDLWPKLKTYKPKSNWLTPSCCFICRIWPWEPLKTLFQTKRDTGQTRFWLINTRRVQQKQTFTPSLSALF